MVKISVIIATYNRCEILKNTLDSLLTQECDGGLDWEVIVVDNNSNDRTKEIIGSYMSMFNGRLRYIYEPKQGKSFALNTAINESKGEIIAFTDDDVVIDKNWLSAIKKAFDKFDCKCFGGRVMPTFEFAIPFWFHKRFLKFGGTICTHNLGDFPFEYSDKTYGYGPCGANMFFKKIIFEKYGFFRTDLGRYQRKKISGEETGFYFRLTENNEKVIFFPQAVVYHPVKKEQLELRNIIKRNFYNGRASVITEKPLAREYISYFRVPRYLIKKTIILFLKAFAAFITLKPADSLLYICRFSNLAGQVYQLAITRTKEVKT